MVNYNQGQHIVEILCPEHFLIKGRGAGYLACHTCINKIWLLFNMSLGGPLEYSIHKALLALNKKAGLLDDMEISLWEASHSGLF